MKFFSKKKIKSFLIEAAKVLIVLACCAGLGIFIAVGQRASSPEKYAEEYFSFYVTNNYEEMYKRLQCEESEFINYETFENKCIGEKIYGSITGYNISKGVKQGKKITYVATYYLGSDKTPHTYTITLNRQKKNVYLFFPTWKVSLEREMIHGYNINVPVNTTVKLDGKDISKYKKGTNEEKTTDSYKIDKVFSGDHTISVSLDATGEITKTQYVSDDNETIEVTTNDFAIKPDVQQKMFEYSTFIVKTIYEYTMDKNKNAENIAIFYANTPEAQESARATYSAFSNAITKPNGATLKIINIKTLSPAIQNFSYPDRVVVKVDFDYEFAALTGTTAIDGITQEYYGGGNDTAFVHLGFIDDAWKIIKVDMNCIDYGK